MDDLLQSLLTILASVAAGGLCSLIICFLVIRSARDSAYQDGYADCKREYGQHVATTAARAHYQWVLDGWEEVEIRMLSKRVGHDDYREVFSPDRDFPPVDSRDRTNKKQE